MTVGDESYGFRHALLREVVYDDLLPGERTEMHAALARALEDTDRGRRARRPHHRRRWRITGPPPATSRRRSRPRCARRTGRRARERLRRGAGAVRARARRCGSGCRTPRRSQGIDQIELLQPRRRRRGSGGRAGAPGGPASARAPSWWTPRPIPRRAALLQERLSQSLWSQHRQDEALEALRELELLPDGRARAPSARRCWPQLARRAWCSRASPRRQRRAREALSVARAVGYREAEAIARSTRSARPSASSGDVEPGVRLPARVARDRSRGWPRDGG